AAYFAALVPLRVYPSDEPKRLKSFPCKDPCIAPGGKGKPPNQTAAPKEPEGGSRSRSND
ncbi:hypothetical protein DXB25_31105, partial [Lachnospiraceae bacterium OM02-31]